MIDLNILNKWQILLFTENDDINRIVLNLKNIGYKRIKKVLNTINSINAGFTYSNLEEKVSIVYIGHATNVSQWFDTLTHELKHVQSHICEYYNISEDSEDAAYLIGYLMRKTIQLL